MGNSPSAGHPKIIAEFGDEDWEKPTMLEKVTKMNWGSFRSTGHFGLISQLTT
jgi:hypothetical protein